MALDPWSKVALPREEVREGRSFNPDEFAIALEQVVGGTAPADYRDQAMADQPPDRGRILRPDRNLRHRPSRRYERRSASTATYRPRSGTGSAHDSCRSSAPVATSRWA